ncbi:FecR family protein [Herbaspirillum robiniae]|uniref:Iron dicitrate transport regulator FecR n=1 Tax=Herbaspirillum robiniae TaxID=2014887 RepID=A0A2D0B6J4_9BURK|nr:FecR domain-containing protein [Herbaspirillum robiniae]OWY29919.1 iron dicitrate transport regulator FecR [Herbaspirillum robiniae]
MEEASVPQAAPQYSVESGLEGQARAWVRLLASGQARREDARRLERWCAISPQHAQAFKREAGLWRQLGHAAERTSAGDAELAAIRRAAAQARLAPPRARLSRRAFIGGAVAASAAAAGVMVVHPPLALWPSLAALQADYRTGIGQQLQVALAPDVDLQLNTRSSVAVRAREGATVGIDLIDGEVAVNTTRPFSVSVGSGLIDTAYSRFEVRRLNGEVCVTCMEGQVGVSVAGRRQVLVANEQLEFGGTGAPVLGRIDAQARSDWLRGVINFRQTALVEVVSEINRYRPGRLVLMADALLQKPVSGRFRIDEMDKAIGQIQRLFRLSATTLPGGIVILA